VSTEDTIAALDRGELRVAEKIDGEWRVNEDAKAAILDYFRISKLEPIEVGPYEYLDKIPLKHNYAELGVRVVPPATARFGSFLSRGVVMMPSYVNIGAWVGPNTMIDTWATVGSCAQIGADVHLAGGVGVGGVLEPIQARPVIVEDGAFIGSRCILTEGVLIGERAVLAPNVSLTGSVPVIDVTGPEPVVLGRRSRHAAEGVPGGDVPARVRAHHRPAQRADRSEDVVERRPARVSDLLSRTGERRAAALEAHAQIAARKVHDDVALAMRRGRHGDGARAGGGRLPHAALPDTCGHLAGCVDARDLDVRPVREVGMRLE
jgi:2,3,4,5-tetrahydropyridine-2-carboxylate N-succinyltransferase